MNPKDVNCGNFGDFLRQYNWVLTMFENGSTKNIGMKFVRHNCADYWFMLHLNKWNSFDFVLQTAANNIVRIEENMRPDWMFFK